EMQQLIAAGSAVKLGIQLEGWYRVTQPQLARAGLSDRVDPRMRRFFVAGVQQPIKVNGEVDHRFDAGDSIEFYAMGVDTPYTDTRVYWLMAGSQPGMRIDTLDGRASGAAGGTSFPFTVERKDRSIYFAALL